MNSNMIGAIELPRNAGVTTAPTADDMARAVADVGKAGLDDAEHVIVFVHGFNTDAKSDANVVGILAKGMGLNQYADPPNGKVKIVSFDWPSVGKASLTGYYQDRETATQYAPTLFLSFIGAVMKAAPKLNRLSFICHSLGNYVMWRIIMQNYLVLKPTIALSIVSIEADITLEQIHQAYSKVFLSLNLLWWTTYINRHDIYLQVPHYLSRGGVDSTAGFTHYHLGEKHIGIDATAAAFRFWQSVTGIEKKLTACHYYYHGEEMTTDLKKLLVDNLPPTKSSDSAVGPGGRNLQFIHAGAWRFHP